MRTGEIRYSLTAFLLSLAMVLSTVFVIMGAQGARADGTDPPIHIHLTWGQDDTAHTIVVTWKTLYENAGDNVLYSTESGGGDPDNYDYSAVGIHHTYSGAGGYIHDTELTGLSPNTVYYFICGGENGGWSDERSFRTAPDQSTALRFVAGGDSRSGGTWPGPRDDVSQEMAKFNPSFVLFEGDLVNQGDYQWEWDNWFAAVQEYWVDNDNLTIPIIPGIGNHELYGDPNGNAYYGQFCLPENEEWYSLNWGPDLHIIVLNSETSISGDQRDWLQKDLAAHENYLWKIAIFHRPPYSGGSHGGNSQIKTYWCPLFDNYHVDLVIAGHDHDYERTYPIYQDNVAPSPENGTVYIVSGGWGAPLYGGSPGWWTAYGPDSRYHFVVIDILENWTLHLKEVDRYGSVFDTFTIIKPAEVEASISPTYQGGPPGSTVNYVVTVTNIGFENDDYVLTVIDNENWALGLGDNTLTIPAGENRNVTLSVTIPDNAVPCTEDLITVTATSTTDNARSDNGSCIAHATAPKAEFSLVTLYKVELDLDVYLESGSKLVVKFYTYMGDNQGENVVWANTTPARVTLLENVPHPLGEPVENSVLVLTENNTANEISTIASFTVTKTDLRNRLIEILILWFAHPELHDEFRAEIIDILVQWFSAPS